VTTDAATARDRIVCLGLNDEAPSRPQGPLKNRSFLHGLSNHPFCGRGARMDTFTLNGKRFVVAEKRSERLMLRPEDVDFLLSLNTRNRKLDRRWVDELYRRIEAGVWVYNGDPVRISDKGGLLDGQHKLHAFQRHGKAMECLVVTGLDEAAWATIDGGKRRTHSQELGIRGVPNAKHVASAATAVWKYLHRRYEGDLRVLVTIQELDALVDSDSDIIEAVSVYRSRKAMLTLRHSQAVTFVLWGAKKSLTDELYGEFVRQMNGDSATKKGDPVHTFKQRMYDDNSSKAKLPTQEIIAIGIKVINNFFSGARPGFIKFQQGERFPELVNYPPLKGRTEK
jgi:hypothetical protein